eukprot:gene4130-6134_t
MGAWSLPWQGSMVAVEEQEQRDEKREEWKGIRERHAGPRLRAQGAAPASRWTLAHVAQNRRWQAAREGAAAASDAVPPERRPKSAGPPARVLRVLQFNCCGLRARFNKLLLLIEQTKPHVVFLQETKLAGNADTPRVPGYDALRADSGRESADNNTPRGGLLTLLAEGLWWHPTRRAASPLHPDDKGTEVQDLTVRPHGSPPERLLNLYVPGAKDDIAWGDGGAFTPAALPTEACVFADLNGHHRAWDKNFTASACGSDPRGRAMHAWATADGRCILNNGEPTRVGAVSRTTPDVTVVPDRFRGARACALL